MSQPAPQVATQAASRVVEQATPKVTPQVASQSSPPPPHIPPRRTWTPGNPVKSHTRKTVIACLVVVVPMVAFTVTLLWIVFAKKVDMRYCPHSEICPKPEDRDPVSSLQYYIDFPVGRLGFVSSLSSTVSFALVACLTMYSYSAANQILKASTTPEKSGALLSPFKTNTLIRLLNAEVLLLLDMILDWFSKTFWHQAKSRSEPKEGSKSPYVVKASLWMFLLGLFVAVLIQAADTYLHLFIEAITVTQLISTKTSLYEYGRALAPWCYDDAGTFGTLGNKYFWSCGLDVEVIDKIQLANESLLISISSNIDAYVLNYTDPKGTTYSLTRSSNIDPDLDWKGSGYGVSSECSAIPPKGCELGKKTYLQPSNQTVGTPDTIWVRSYDCSNSTYPYNVTGNFTAYISNYRFDNWHEYLQEVPPFYNLETQLLGLKEASARAPNTTREETNTIFQNPWSWTGYTLVLEDNQAGALDAFNKSEIPWKIGETDFFIFVVCNTTVWDVNYTIVDNQVAEMSASKSNGSVTGLVSMLGLNTLLFYNKQGPFEEMNRNVTTPEAFISRYEASMSKMFTSALVAHSIPTTVNVAQRRVRKIITRLPTPAFWLLVATNLLYATLAVVLAIVAIRASSPAVHQIQTRLSTAGLVAQLFDPQYAARRVDSDLDLFEEKAEKNGPHKVTKRIEVVLTDQGGSEFVARNI